LVPELVYILIVPSVQLCIKILSSTKAAGVPNFAKVKLVDEVIDSNGNIVFQDPKLLPILKYPFALR
jgi:hypothetical protein